MTQEQAMNIIKQACASIQANLETHNQMQIAIQTLEVVLNDKPKTTK